MPTMPRERSPDSTAALLVEGYEFISNRCRKHGSDVFEARILLQPTICMRGRDAAELFYDPSRFRRQGAAPRRMQRTLFGRGGVQGLDGEAHRHRKQAFLDLMGPERIDALVEEATERWRARLGEWEDRDEVVLYDEVGRLLTEAVHAWAGVPLAQEDVDRRLHDLHGMIVGGGGLGPNVLQGRWGRRRAERALAQVVASVRDARLTPSTETALHRIAWHRELDGSLLSEEVAAVELLNVLRPTVAVDRFVVFAAMALHAHPEWRDRLRSATDEEVTAFVHEVRRSYPFFPAAVARVRETFEWRGHRFPEGRRVLLDLFATDHDPAVWEDPAAFRPERFLGREPDPYGFVPQGGGDHRTDHRCAGEWLTVELMRRAVRLLTSGIAYDVPPQDLRLQRGKIPALPTSGFRITRVRPVAPATAG